MGKKLILLGMAVAAVAAFAMPAAASASPQLFEGATALAKEATIIGTSSNALTTNTALGTLECKTVTVNAELDKNAGTEIEAHGTEAATTTCNAGGLPLTVTKPTLVSLNTKEKDEGTLTLTFIADVGPFECHFEGTGKFTYVTTEPNNNKLSIAGIPLTAAEVCMPEEGAPSFEGDFALTTTGGQVIRVK